MKSELVKPVVVRYCANPSAPPRPGIDFLRVVDGDGTILLDCRMGPDGPLHPSSAHEARDRPWFYTGSPFGAEIIELAEMRAKAGA